MGFTAREFSIRWLPLRLFKCATFPSRLCIMNQSLLAAGSELTLLSICKGGAFASDLIVLQFGSFAKPSSGTGEA